MAVKVTCVVVAALICVLVSSPTRVVGAITCGQVTSSLAPCLGYLRGTMKLPPACCSGVKKLNSAAQTTNDRRTACSCLVTASKTFKGINLGLAAGLPEQCGVKIPYKISPNTDCSKVN